MGATEIEQFLTHLAVNGYVAASTQNQALNALLFLYKKVLEMDLPLPGENIQRAKKSRRLPVVLTRDEVRRVLACVSGDFWLMTSLLYGAGLRISECLRLRYQGIQPDYGQTHANLSLIKESHEKFIIVSAIQAESGMN
jgi:site-specific recombinase XerD